METYQLRVKKETEALSDKIDKLDTFIKSDTFTKLTKIEQNLLTTQLTIMGQYLKILNMRIELFVVI